MTYIITGTQRQYADACLKLSGEVTPYRIATKEHAHGINTKIVYTYGTWKWLPGIGEILSYLESHGTRLEPLELK